MAKSGYQNRIELLQGTLDMLILKTLQWGEQHGYGHQSGDSGKLGGSFASRDRVAVSSPTSAGTGQVGFC